jgi:hypothetical protein
MSEIRFNRWSHQSGTGGIYQDSSGNIGIGTSVPTSVLDIQGGSIKIGNDLLTSSGVSTFTSGLNVTGGSVGIGTDNPSAPLHIYSSEDRGILIESTDANAYIVFKDTDTSSDFANRVGTISDGLYFNTGGGGERLRITSSGRLSIGNYSSPKAPLHIRGEYLDQAPVAGIGTGSFVISNSDTNYGINFGVRSSGTGWIQQTRVDGTGTNYSLLLNPLGGNIGIGTDNPESGSKLTVNGGIYVKSYLSAATTHGGAIDYVTDSRGLRILSYGASGAKTAITFAQGNGGSGASEIARFNTSGNLVFATSGQGIDFSATSDASGSTSELLDDYEEGTWTPAIASGGWSLGTTYFAKYVKIGRQVTVQLYITLTGSGNSNVFQISGLPFNPASNGYSTGVADFNKPGLSGIYVRATPGTDTVSYLYSNNSASTQRSELNGGQIGDGYHIFTLTYQV